MIDDALRSLISETVTAAVAPLVEEVRQLRAAVASSAAKWVSRREAAEILKVSVDTVDRMIERRDLQVRRAGRTVRVLLQAPATDIEIARIASEARAL